MPSPSSSSWAETALIAGAAAALSTFVVLRLLERKRDDDHTSPVPIDSVDQTRYYVSGHESATIQEYKHHGWSDHRHPAPRCDSALEHRYTVLGHDEAMTLQNVGWSMEEAKAKASAISKRAKYTTPSQVLQGLQKGNSRFWTGRANRPGVCAFERRALIAQQFPSTAVLGCADSRVPVEIIFDQGLGDLFVVRVAGNCLFTATEASLEYAVHHLEVKVLLVLGHEGCGAIKAAGLPLDKIEQEPAPLCATLKKLREGLQSEHLSKITDVRARDRERVTMNVRNQITQLCQDQQIMAKVNNGNLIIVGGFYEISSGIVDFFMQVSQPNKGDFKPSPGVQCRYNPVTDEIVAA
jgi:carbonic anhydrase